MEIIEKLNSLNQNPKSTWCNTTIVLLWNEKKYILFTAIERDLWINE